MILELAQDFHDALAAMPREHPKRRVLELFEEAVRRDIHFIARHPTTLFQCMWNTCWWYDCPEAERHYEKTEVNSEARTRTSDVDRGPGLWRWVEEWRASRTQDLTGVPWVRCIRPPPIRLGGGLTLVLTGHRARVNAVAYSPDGRRIASGASDNTIRTWDAQSGQELARFANHEGAVNAIAWDPQGRYLLSGSEDLTVRTWDVQAGTELVCLRGHEKGIEAVAWQPDGAEIASGSDDGTIRVWRSSESEWPAVVLQAGDAVQSVAYSHDGQRIVATGGGGWHAAAWVWHAQTREKLGGMRCGEHWGLCIDCSPDGRHVATGGRDGTVRVWDLRTSTEVFCLGGHEEAVKSVAYSRDGRFLASGSEDGSVLVRDARTGSPVLRFTTFGRAVRSIAFRPAGRQIAVACTDGAICVWDVEGAETTGMLRGHRSPISCVAADPNGTCVATGSGAAPWFSIQPRAARDNTVRIWHTATGEELHRLEGHERVVREMAFSPDGRMLATASEDKTVRIWDSRSGAALHCLRGHGRGVHHVAFSPDGQCIASGSENGRVRLWASQTGQEMACLSWDGCSSVASLAFSPDSRCLAVEDSMGNLYLWDARNAERAGYIPLGEKDLAAKTGTLDVQRVDVLFPEGVLRYDLAKKKWVAVRRSANDREVPEPEEDPCRPTVTVKEIETVLEDRVSGVAFAWFPAVLDGVTAIPGHMDWAAYVGKDLYLFALEAVKS